MNLNLPNHSYSHYAKQSSDSTDWLALTSHSQHATWVAGCDCFQTPLASGCESHIGAHFVCKLATSSRVCVTLWHMQDDIGALHGQIPTQSLLHSSEPCLCRQTANIRDDHWQPWPPTATTNLPCSVSQLASWCDGVFSPASRHRQFAANKLALIMAVPSCGISDYKEPTVMAIY